jgi:endonuclease IV
MIQKFNQKPIGDTAYWIDLCSDYEYVRHAWILEAMREIKTARKIGIHLINFHANLNGMFYREKRKILLDNMIRILGKL